MHLQKDRITFQSRTRPRLVAGQLLELNYEPSLQTLVMKAQSPPAGQYNDEALKTIIYIPVHVKTNDIGVEGSASLDNVIVEPDGSRIVLVKVNPTGQYYSVNIGKTNNNKLMQISK